MSRKKLQQVFAAVCMAISKTDFIISMCDLWKAVYFAIRGKSSAGAILPLSEPEWLNGHVIRMLCLDWRMFFVTW